MWEPEKTADEKVTQLAQLTAGLAGQVNELQKQVLAFAKLPFQRPELLHTLKGKAARQPCMMTRFSFTFAGRLVGTSEDHGIAEPLSK
jgi:hypothetical protein